MTPQRTPARPTLPQPEWLSLSSSQLPDRSLLLPLPLLIWLKVKGCRLKVGLSLRAEIDLRKVRLCPASTICMARIACAAYLSTTECPQPGCSAPHPQDRLRGCIGSAIHACFDDHKHILYLTGIPGQEAIQSHQSVGQTGCHCQKDQRDRHRRDDHPDERDARPAVDRASVSRPGVSHPYPRYQHQE